MNIEKYLPYWHQGRHFVNRFEMKSVLYLDGWQHPDQHGLFPRPDGYEILRVIESQFLHRAIGLITLLYYQQYPHQRPEIFRDIYMCGWLDVFYAPYPEALIDSKKPPLFVPALTPLSADGRSTIHWMNLNSGFNCLDFIVLKRPT